MDMKTEEMQRAKKARSRGAVNERIQNKSREGKRATWTLRINTSKVRGEN